MARRLLLAVCSFVFSGCASNYFSAPVGGATLSAQDAAFALVRSGSDVIGAIVRISSEPNVCDTAKADRRLKGATELTFQFVKKNPDGKVIAPDTGDYTIEESTLAFTKNSVATATWEKLDSSCNNTLGSNGTGKSGTVNVESFSIQEGGRMAGKFDVTFGSQGDKVTGGFNAVYCELNSLPLFPNCE